MLYDIKLWKEKNSKLWANFFSTGQVEIMTLYDCDDDEFKFDDENNMAQLLHCWLIKS